MSPRAIDDHAKEYVEEDKEKARLIRDKQGYMRREDLRYEFDCPDCDANNPYDEGFKGGDEVRCNYCGQEFRIQMTDEGKIKFKAI